MRQRDGKKMMRAILAVMAVTSVVVTFSMPLPERSFGLNSSATGALPRGRSPGINRPTGEPPSSRGCLLEGRLSREVFAEGEEIRIDLRLVNESPVPVTMWVSGFAQNHRVVVRDGHGIEPQLTESGRQFRASFAPSGDRDRNYRVVIPPGGDHADGCPVALSQLYRLGVGCYSVEITYHAEQAPTPIKVTSNSLPFEVR